MQNTVAELPEYIKRADSLLGESERKGVIDYLSEHPKAGNVMEGTGGIRKLRWRKGNKGKSGGVRIIYYYHDDRIPLYLLTMFGKNEQANLTKADRNSLSKLIKILIAKALEKYYD
ncbi:type II toxin-antitoxin system RelE/ParE family toxin [Paraglaciecola aquimarina]|uniref:Type II toxin-antitoxin system RelE/ParE family toxin n=1 Tax=Paraglaciecola algarum TaxID=3050085 RepID=A0ABS9D2L8_9ALTE|nr:type II toxin-antitoxin system RelE/ParE family toxin [Paraglaciecola sp. G1-23]MCF2947172.1 type II toxin-antitoxin system RelE/ParE family toxin [Paraglaciecola sp. G1-23]